MRGRVLYRNGRVHTPGRSDVTALLVDGDRVALLGTEADAESWGSDVTVVDLQHALVTPAFVDAHVHATATGLALTGLDLRGTASLAEAVRRIGDAARAGRGRPLLGGGWDDTAWPEGRAPTRTDLDRASYGGVVYLARVDVHSAVVSSALLAGVPGIDGLDGYRADGWLRGPAHDAARGAAQALVTPAQRREAQRATLARAAALGVAAVHEMAGPVISSADDLLDLLSLARAGDTPEVTGYWAELGGIDTARELGAVGAAGDLFCDGSLGSHTAALTGPYEDRPDTAGSLRFELAEVVEHVLACELAGLQAGFHAIGDAAVDQVVAAFETAGQRLGRPVGPGHRVEHAEYVRDPDRLAATGLTASVQPCFDALWGGADGMYARRLGTARADRLNRFAALARAGVPLAFGSDSPVTELGPWAAVHAAVATHEPSSALDLGDAFAAHTAGGWRAGGQADAGVLAPGAPATFAVWPAASLEAATRERPGALATVLRGRAIHDTGLLGTAGG